LIDTHCHLLPGLDDGPPTTREALELARALVADGIERVLCTPHYSRLWAPAPERAAERLVELRAALQAEGVPLDLELAAEVSPAFAVSATFDELRRRSIGSRYVLVEVQPDTPLGFFAIAADRLESEGIRPVFAHPERSRALQRHPAALDAVRARGGLVQVVAPSLLGRWGAGTARAGWSLLDHGRADLLASDAHGAGRRRPHLGEAAALVTERLGDALRTQLVVRHPSALLDAY
jgi:protein-tyrosine phosphatase